MWKFDKHLDHWEYICYDKVVAYTHQDSDKDWVVSIAGNGWLLADCVSVSWAKQGAWRSLGDAMKATEKFYSR